MTLSHCNKILLERYGTHVFDSKPIFRIVFSNNELEYRKGLFGPLMIFPEVRQVPKYPYAKNCFVLEKFAYIGQQPELVNVSGYSYEPIWVFQDAKGQPQELLWEAVEALIYKLMNHTIERKNDSMVRGEHQAIIDKEAEENLVILEDAMRSYSTEVVDRETV
jgi:hypothetical protein